MHRIEIRLTCSCGHTYQVECVLADLGQAPIICPACKLTLRLQHVQPKVLITADPRKPPDEMISVERVEEDDDTPKVH